MTTPRQQYKCGTARDSSGHEHVEKPSWELTVSPRVITFPLSQRMCTGQDKLHQQHQHQRYNVCDAKVQDKWPHNHRSWRTTARPSIIAEPKQQTYGTELSITSWNPDTLNHGKLERLLTFFDKTEDEHNTKGRKSQGHNHSGQVRMVLKRISNLFVGLEFWGIQQSCMRSADRHSRSDFWNSADCAEVRSAEVTARPHGRNQGENLASTQRSHNFGYAPQENGPSEHKKHFWDHVPKTMAKLPRRTSIILEMYPDAAIGWQHSCETLTDNGAHINESAQRRFSGAQPHGMRNLCR